jgi:hypothetical protein
MELSESDDSMKDFLADEAPVVPEQPRTEVPASPGLLQRLQEAKRQLEAESQAPKSLKNEVIDLFQDQPLPIPVTTTEGSKETVHSHNGKDKLPSEFQTPLPSIQPPIDILEAVSKPGSSVSDILKQRLKLKQQKEAGIAKPGTILDGTSSSAPLHISVPKIGLNETIVKMSELNSLYSAEEKERLTAYYDRLAGLEAVSHFERNCALTFDLTDSLQVFHENIRSGKSAGDIEEKGAQALQLPQPQPESDLAEFKVAPLNKAGFPINYIESWDFYDKLSQKISRNLEEGWQDRRGVFEDYTKLLKTYDVIRQERAREDQERKQNKNPGQKKHSANEFALDDLFNDGLYSGVLETPILGGFDHFDDRFVPESQMNGARKPVDATPVQRPVRDIPNDWNDNFMEVENQFDDNQWLNARDMMHTPVFGAMAVTPVVVRTPGEAAPVLRRDSSAYFNLETLSLKNLNAESVNVNAKRVSDGSENLHWEYDCYSVESMRARRLRMATEQLVEFKRGLKRVKQSGYCPIQPTTQVSRDLKDPSFFNYSVYPILRIAEMESALKTSLKLDIYALKRVDLSQEIRQFNYKNPAVVSSLVHPGLQEFLDTWGRRMPFLDLNDEYVRAVVNGYSEDTAGLDENKPTIIIADKKRDKDDPREKQANMFKKMYRMRAIIDNEYASSSEDFIQRIFKDKNSDVANLLLVDKEPDLNEKEEIMKLRRHRVTAVAHTKVAEDFQLTEFEITSRVRNLYRNDISGVVLRAKFLKEENRSWRVSVVGKRGESFLANKLRRDEGTKTGLQNHEILKTPKRLSLRTDDFVLFEYIERDPLILGDFGMGSRIEKWICPTRLAKLVLRDTFGDRVPHVNFNQILGQAEELVNDYRETEARIFGRKGEDVYFAQEQNLPTVGQLTQEDLPGITLLENNLSRTPIFPHQVPKTDFLLICSEIDGKKTYYLRRIKAAYTASQIQPKMEVFAPSSRDYNAFLRRFLRFYIKNAFSKNQPVDIEKAKEVFPSLNDNNLRRHLKAMGGEEDLHDRKKFIQVRESNFEPEDAQDDGDTTVRPEDLCLYKRMHQSYERLRYLGIVEIKSTDRLSVLKTKFSRRNLDSPRKVVIANRIFEEVELSAWHISQSFKSCLQGQGQMRLEGFGDPTKGHGGINFIKKPLKISRYESKLNKNAQRHKTNQIVTGTDSDLRGLTMEQAHKILIRNGFSEAQLNKLERWDKIEILRDVANRALEKSEESELDPILMKFVRNTRMTTEEQKKKYQKDINSLTMKMVRTLSKNEPPEEPADGFVVYEDLEALVDEQKKELERDKKMNVKEDEDPAAAMPRQTKKKSIVLKDCMRRKV